MGKMWRQHAGPDLACSGWRPGGYVNACVCGRGRTVRWRYKLGAEDILGLTAKTILPNEPQLGAARLRGREKD